MADQLRFRNRGARKLHHWADWRCQEPVVVFESDDWGMERRACADFIKTFATPGDWADEESETPEDLNRLYDTLERHHDPNGRSALFTANFVLANPDFDSIQRDRFGGYFDTPVGQNDRLASHWLEGFERCLFLPQYHGRAHFWPDAW